MNEKHGPKLNKRRVLGRKDARRLREEASELHWPLEYDTLERAQIEDGTIVYILDGVIQLARRDDTLFPTLNNPNLAELPSVIVDMGAIPYICNGADVMVPGIKGIRGDFREGALVIVRDIEHGKALVLGEALVSTEELGKMDKGKAIRNLHYVGDRLWKAIG